MLESRAIALLSTFVDELASRIHPLDFTALLYLRDQGYVDVCVEGGQVMAVRTERGMRFILERLGRRQPGSPGSER
jgi:hypothetical protein